MAGEVFRGIGNLLSNMGAMLGEISREVIEAEDHYDETGERPAAGDGEDSFEHDDDDDENRPSIGFNFDGGFNFGFDGNERSVSFGFNMNDGFNFDFNDNDERRLNFGFDGFDWLRPPMDFDSDTGITPPDADSDTGVTPPDFADFGGFEPHRPPFDGDSDTIIAPPDFDSDTGVTPPPDFGGFEPHRPPFEGDSDTTIAPPDVDSDNGVTPPDFADFGDPDHRPPFDGDSDTTIAPPDVDSDTSIAPPPFGKLDQRAWFEKDDALDTPTFDFNNDDLSSIINDKPLSLADESPERSFGLDSFGLDGAFAFNDRSNDQIGGRQSSQRHHHR